MQDGDSLFEIEGDPKLKSARFLNFLLEQNGIGSAKALQIAQSFMTLEEVFTHLAGMGLNNREIKELPELDSEYPIEALSYFDDLYPASLRDLPNPPALLWVMGRLPDGLTLAVVGTRNPTPDAVDITAAICRTLDAGRNVLVSGLADGIDSIAHSASLEHGVRNIAVLGHGFAEIWRSPKVNLALQILEGGGALVTEYAPFVRSTQGSFVARDRIIASLARTTLVIECGIPSGTLHTVRDALNMGRSVVVVEQSNKTTQNLGNQYLLGSLESGLSKDQRDWVDKNKLNLKPEWLPHVFPVQTVGQVRVLLK
jgi:DNA processing protein